LAIEVVEQFPRTGRGPNPRGAYFAARGTAAEVRGGLERGGVPARLNGRQRSNPQPARGFAGPGPASCPRRSCLRQPGVRGRVEPGGNPSCRIPRAAVGPGSEAAQPSGGFGADAGSSPGPEHGAAGRWWRTQVEGVGSSGGRGPGGVLSSRHGEGCVEANPEGAEPSVQDQPAPRTTKAGARIAAFRRKVSWAPGQTNAAGENLANPARRGGGGRGDRRPNRRTGPGTGRDSPRGFHLRAWKTFSKTTAGATGRDPEGPGPSSCRRTGGRPRGPQAADRVVLTVRCGVGGPGKHGLRGDHPEGGPRVPLRGGPGFPRTPGRIGVTSLPGRRPMGSSWRNGEKKQGLRRDVLKGICPGGEGTHSPRALIFRCAAKLPVAPMVREKTSGGRSRAGDRRGATQGRPNVFLRPGLPAPRKTPCSRPRAGPLGKPPAGQPDEAALQSIQHQNHRRGGLWLKGWPLHELPSAGAAGAARHRRRLRGPRRAEGRG